MAPWYFHNAWSHCAWCGNIALIRNVKPYLRKSRRGQPRLFVWRFKRMNCARLFKNNPTIKRSFIPVLRHHHHVPGGLSVFPVPWSSKCSLSLHLFFGHPMLLRLFGTRVGTLIVATIYLQLIQNRYMFRSFTLLQCSHQHCVQPVASDVEVVGYL